MATNYWSPDAIAARNPAAKAVRDKALGASTAGTAGSNTDFFGEGTGSATGPSTAVQRTEQQPALHAPGTAGAAGAPTQTTSGYAGGTRDVTGGTGVTHYDLPDNQATEGYGATTGYYRSGDQTQANYDYMHDLGSPDAVGSVTDLLNTGGENVGVSRAGDAIDNSYGGLANPLNPMGYLQGGVKPMVDPNTGLGVSGTGASVGSMAPGAAAVLTQPTGLGDALDSVMSGGGSLPNFDASGADRGGAGRIDANMVAQRGQEALARNPAGGAGAQQQQDVLDQVMAFANAQPTGPSKAELLLQQASQGNMADVLSAARSGRARDAGSQARAMNVAQGEIAGLGVDAARNAALLRAQEAQDFRNQQLSALGLGGDVSGAIRGAGIQERGQNLGLESDILGTIPALEGVRHQDEFELTPQQKLLAAKLGGQRDPTTADYVTGLLGDLLPVVGSAIG